MTVDQIAERKRQADAIQSAAMAQLLSPEAFAAFLERGKALTRRFALSLRATSDCPHRLFLDGGVVSCERCPALDLFGVIAADHFACDEYSEAGRSDK